MKSLDLQSAQKLIAMALEKAAKDFKRPICVAVCNAQGFLLAFAYGDGAPVRSIDLSQGKAYSAARLGVNTDAFLERLHRENILPSYFCDNRLTGLPGGAVIKNADGQVLGGAGISGLTSAEDQIIANSMAEMILKNAV